MAMLISAHERGCIHAKRNFVGMPGIQQQAYADAGLCDDFVHFLRLLVSPASLDIAMQKMVGHGVQYRLG